MDQWARKQRKMDAIQFAEVYCPFASRLSPFVQAAHEHTLAWSTRFRLIQKEAAVHRFLASRFAWLSARAYPLAEQGDLEVVNDWMTWLFLFDDQFDDGFLQKRLEHVPSILADYIAVIRQPDTAPLPGPAASALRDLCQRTFPLMSDFWVQRFIQHFTSYFSTYTWAVNNALSGVIPDLNEYIEMRRHSGGMTMAIDLIEFVLHQELPVPLLLGPEFALMARLTNDVVCWSNDIISFEKERARGDPNNLVLVLQQACHLTLQEAVDKASWMASQAVSQFEQAERSLPSGTPDLEEAREDYLLMLKSWMRGNLDWSAETFRYQHIECPAPGAAVSYLEDIVSTAQR